MLRGMGPACESPWSCGERIPTSQAEARRNPAQLPPPLGASSQGQAPQRLLQLPHFSVIPPLSPLPIRNRGVRPSTGRRNPAWFKDLRKTGRIGVASRPEAVPQEKNRKSGRRAQKANLRLCRVLDAFENPQQTWGPHPSSALPPRRGGMVGPVGIWVPRRYSSVRRKPRPITNTAEVHGHSTPLWGMFNVQPALFEGAKARTGARRSVGEGS